MNNPISGSEIEKSVDEFAERFVQSSGKVYFCKSSNDLLPTIEKIIAEKNTGNSCLYTREAFGIISEGTQGNKTSNQAIDSAILYDPQNSDALDTLGKVDIGITVADFAVAETGSLVEIAYTDSQKLLSSLSRINIVILRAAKVISKLEYLAPILRRILSATEDKPTVTLIGGPSRTADIEMKMVLGVHGPHEVHVVIIS